MNNLLNYVTDAAFLQEWFELNKTTLWNLYRGFHSRVPERDVIYKQQDSTKELNASWELLWRMIQHNSVGGGKFTIYIPAYAGNKAATLHFGVNLAATPAAPGWGMPSVAGMPGAPTGFVSEDRLAQAIANEREKWDMARRIEELEAAEGASSDIWDVLIDKVREVDPNTTLPAAISGLMDLFKPRPTVQLHGVQEDHQPPTGEQPQGYAYQQELLIPFLDSIRQHFDTDEAFWTFLNAVSVKFNANPNMFKSIVANG